MHNFYQIVGQAMTSVSSLDELRTNFHKVMSAFDLDQYTYQVVQHKHFHNLENFFVTTYPQEWEAHYLDQNYFSEDPLVHQYLNNSSPFVWGLDTFASSTPKAKKMMIEAGDFNLQHGIGIPIPGPDNSFSILTLCSKNATAKELQEIYQNYYKDFLICGLMFHSSFLSLNLNSQIYATYDLTNKELECLKWMCVGKSNPEIAAILGISVNGVKERNKNIFKKLGVYSKIDAVMKAYKYKIIEQ